MNDRVEMKFKIGDKVVHPQHGVGFVANIEEKKFDSKVSRTYYVISIPDTTLWVPVGQPSSGLRKLSLRSDLEQCRQILQSAPLILSPDRGLMASLIDRIKQGMIIGHCEVVRDLAAYGWRKSLFGPLSDFRQTTLDVLCQEWAAIEGILQADASFEIDGLLRKGRVFFEN